MKKKGTKVEIEQLGHEGKAAKGPVIKKIVNKKSLLQQMERQLTPKAKESSNTISSNGSMQFNKIASKVALYNKGEPLVQISMVDQGRDKKFSILSADQKSVATQGSQPSSAIDNYAKNANAVRQLLQNISGSSSLTASKTKLLGSQTKQESGTLHAQKAQLNQAENVSTNSGQVLNIQSSIEKLKENSKAPLSKTLTQSQIKNVVKAQSNFLDAQEQLNILISTGFEKAKQSKGKLSRQPDLIRTGSRNLQHNLGEFTQSHTRNSRTSVAKGKTSSVRRNSRKPHQSSGIKAEQFGQPVTTRSKSTKKMFNLHPDEKRQKKRDRQPVFNSDSANIPKAISHHTQSQMNSKQKAEVYNRQEVKPKKLIFQNNQNPHLRIQTPKYNSQTTLLTQQLPFNAQSTINNLQSLMPKSVAFSSAQTADKGQHAYRTSPYVAKHPEPSTASATLHAMIAGQGSLTLSNNSHPSTRHGSMIPNQKQSKRVSRNDRSAQRKMRAGVNKLRQSSGSQSLSEYQLQGKISNITDRKKSISPVREYDQIGSGLHHEQATYDQVSRSYSKSNSNHSQQDQTPLSGQTSEHCLHVKLYQQMHAQRKKIKRLQQQLQAKQLLDSLKMQVDELSKASSTELLIKEDVDPQTQALKLLQQRMKAYIIRTEQVNQQLALKVVKLQSQLQQKHRESGKAKN